MKKDEYKKRLKELDKKIDEIRTQYFNMDEKLLDYYLLKRDELVESKVQRGLED